ncbi:MAG: glycosyltransferase family 2 protein [Labilithrix sp.]|nr:glycosyltransferase family 2 protein [Labilithrix sp.]
MGETTIRDLGVPEPKRTAATNGEARPWLERACILVPALDAERTIADVIADVTRAIPERADAIFVIDDGSSDATARIAEEMGCAVVASSGASIPRGEREPRRANRGKGAALRAGLEAARARGMSVALTIDADGQHPADEARRVLFAPDAGEAALVLGVRDLVRDGAPRANRFSNGISNHFLSTFARRPLRDTQCGLRRYPIRETLALRTTGQGYDFEAEVLLRAIWAGLDVVEEPVRVLYPEDRTTHFRVGRDVTRIIKTVLATVGERWLLPHRGREEA